MSYSRNCFAVVLLCAASILAALAQNQQTPSTTGETSTDKKPAAGEATPTPAPKKIRVSSGVSDGLLKKKVAPTYPWKAKAKGIQGDVLLQIVIAKDGRISKMTVISGDPLLTAAAVDAVKKWVYKPYTLDGQPVEVETTVKISFRM